MERPDVPLDLSSRLNARRRELGMSTAELGRAMGLSRSHVESLMSGKRTPNAALSEKLIVALRLSDDFAAELRVLTGSRYRSGFVMGDFTLTKD